MNDVSGQMARRISDAVAWQDGSSLPAHAVARLVRHSGPPGAMGRRRAGEWVLTFPPRWRGRIDPLTGWWGGGDPLASLALRFPTRQAAEAYARREGLALEICEPQAHGPVSGAPDADAALRTEAPADPALCWAWDGRSAAADVVDMPRRSDGRGGASDRQNTRPDGADLSAQPVPASGGATSLGAPPVPPAPAAVPATHGAKAHAGQRLAA